LKRILASEAALTALAGCTAQRWAAAGITAAVIGLKGDLGAGKTTWVRALLRGLGHAGAVPSPTYTLVEAYALGPVEIMHLDLYRIAADDELEALGLREWVGRAWVIAEWPQNSEVFSKACDLMLELELEPADGRTLHAEALTPIGDSLLRLISDCASSN
jgi:tRNA threonylcarbamoyladenosine biosynthesis protein TsaE